MVWSLLHLVLQNVKVWNILQFTFQKNNGLEPHVLTFKKNGSLMPAALTLIAQISMRFKRHCQQYSSINVAAHRDDVSKEEQH